ncbi:hypothetical protein Lfu02_14370 [Longispora fulva]|nr:hypothetical protein Lfu02_14370 [Longispora fulva]
MLRVGPEIKQDMLRVADQDVAAGRLFGPDGRDLTGMFGPGDYGPAQGGHGLKEPWKGLDSMTRHVEGHAAALMRRDGI